MGVFSVNPGGCGDVELGYWGVVEVAAVDGWEDEGGGAGGGDDEGGKSFVGVEGGAGEVFELGAGSDDEAVDVFGLAVLLCLLEAVGVDVVWEGCGHGVIVGWFLVLVGYLEC